MTWNYRVVRKTDEAEPLYGIHEVYYDSDGKPEMVTVEPVAIVGDSLLELQEEFVHYLRALLKPVLNYEEIPDE